MRRFCTLLLATASLLAVAPDRGTAEEIVTSELVFQRPSKLKRIRATTYLPLEDPTLRGAAEEVPSSVRCGVKGRDRKGTVAATGRLELRLLGVGTGEEPERWRSASLVATLDERGGALVPGSELEELLDAAEAEGARPEILRLDFAGGRGGRLLSLTLDCRRSEEEEG